MTNMDVSSSDQTQTILSLVLMTIGAVLFVVVLPACLIASFCYLRRLQKRARAKMDPQTLTSVVTVEPPTRPAESAGRRPVLLPGRPGTSTVQPRL